MSTIIMAAVWPLQGMSASQKAVLVSLADQANDDGACWPSVKTLTMRTCLSERAVRDALAWLQAAGVVFREYRSNTSTNYTVCPKRFDPSKAPAESKRTAKRKTEVGANAAPPCGCRPSGKCRSTPGGSRSTSGKCRPSRGAAAAPKSSGEPSLNHQ